MKAFARASALAVGLALAILGTTVLPASATGVSAALTNFSPNLDNGFPCGLGNIAPLTTLQNFVNNSVPSYANTSNKCTGTIWQSGGTAPNTVSWLGAGTDNTGAPFLLGGNGTLAANYYYEEPCQTNPADGSKSAETGEAYGTFSLNLSQAAGALAGGSFAGPATVTLTFWWSRVGVTAIVGFRNATITAGSKTVSTSTGATGLAAALFTETVSQIQAGCASGPAPLAGQIDIVLGQIVVAP